MGVLPLCAVGSAPTPVVGKCLRCLPGRQPTFCPPASCNIYVAPYAKPVMSQAERPAAEAAGDTSFEEFVAGSSPQLFALARLLTGGHQAEAEDLLQSAFERAYRHWRRISQREDPGRYVRQILVNASVDRWRRLRRRPEGPMWLPGGDSAVADQAAEVADRDLLLRGLAVLPTRQRAVLVLRYFEDLSEAQTAALLGCSVGTVKSQAARALARLREITAEPAAPGPAAPGGQRHE